MTDDIGRRTTFDGVAQLYDEVRPGYPEQLFDDIVTLSGIPDSGRMLEIGCGTGKATVSFAERGYAMHCLELGENLAAMAAHKCRGYPNVQIEATSFEDWPAEVGAFDLVFSAQAFHWIPNEIGYSKSAAVLKPGGHLALFWNLYPPGESALRSDLDELYVRHAPEISDRTIARSSEQRIAVIQAFIDDSGHFGPVEIRQYPWMAVYTADQYINLLNTYSDHISLSETTRHELYAAIRALIDEHGGSIVRPYLAVLFCAQVV